MATQTAARDFYTIEEIADRCGITASAVYARVAAGNMPGVRRFGRRIVISRIAYERWLAEGDARVGGA